MSRPRTDQGAGSALVLSMLMVLVAATFAVIGVGAILVAHRQAQAAADLAALAGAGAAQLGADSCGRATSVAARNGARLVGCLTDGEIVMVTVRVTLNTPWGAWSLFGKARSGPADPTPG